MPHCLLSCWLFSLISLTECSIKNKIQISISPFQLCTVLIKDQWNLSQIRTKVLVYGEIGLTLTNSDRTACTNTLSNNPNGLQQACFSLKNQCIPFPGPLVTWLLLQIVMQIGRIH